jgi:uncharacterized membrane protein YoaK (UPF0700 family)
MKDTPTWVYVGGAALTMIAGCVNTVGLLGIHHQALCHMSGLMTMVGMDFGTGQSLLALHALAVVFAFFVGSMVSGFLIRQSTLQIGRRYGLVLAMESALLFMAAHFLRHGFRSGDYIAAMACGLQNAMASSYSGSVVRTTHVTGMVTDLGIACGQLLRGQVVEWARFRLYGVLLIGFVAGSYLGAVEFTRLGYDTLFYPATFAGVVGLFHAITKHIERQQHHRAEQAKLKES